MKKQLQCLVELLDGKNFVGNVHRDTPGSELLDGVCLFAGISERGMFGLLYDLDGSKFWLKLDRPVSKQIKGDRAFFNFAVKYYLPNPILIKDEMARYYLLLQLKSDILNNRLLCSFVSLAILNAYAIQSQVGDHREEIHGPGVNYIRPLQFCHSPSNELLEKIVELHKIHSGMLPAKAEIMFLENAHRLSLYGVHMHPVRDVQGLEMSIGIHWAGILVYLDQLRIDRYVWARIIKMSRDKDQFIVYLRPSEGTRRKNSKVVFKSENSKKAKLLWQLAVDHHLFFRMKEKYDPSEVMASRHGLLSPFNEAELSLRAPASRVEAAPSRLSVCSSSDHFRSSGPSLRMTERGESHVVEEPEAYHTLDIVGRPRSSMGDWPREVTDDSESQDISSPWDHPDIEERIHNPGFLYDNGYEPCGNYLFRRDSARISGCTQVGQRGGPSHQVRYKVQGFSQESDQHQGGICCQHGDILDHESPKMIFQDQCHHTCSCDQVLGVRQSEFDGQKLGRRCTEEELRFCSSFCQSRLAEPKERGEPTIETCNERGGAVLQNNPLDNEVWDMKLNEAIQDVTDVNNSLIVEKIEIRAGGVLL